MRKVKRELVASFVRTMNNCRFYEDEERLGHLLDEIGTLRGLAYALEAVGICPHSEEFLRYIDMSQSLMQALDDD